MPDFTPKQLAAVDISRLGHDACIVAGPGSGKTTVLVERYRQLVESGVQPREILAITFTEKAAANMKDKMVKAFASNPDVRRQIEAAYISTVHGFCQRLLKENAIAAGIDPQFAVLDERQGQIRRARCAVDALDEFFRDQRPETERLMVGIDQPDALATTLVDVHDAIRSAGVSLAHPILIDPPPVEASLDFILRFIADYRCFVGTLTHKRIEYRDQLADWGVTARAAYSERRWDRLAIAATFKFLAGSVHPDWKDRIRQAQEHADTLLGTSLALLYAQERRTLIAILELFDRLYTADKQSLGALDFADLEHFAIRLLEETPAVRTRIQSQFRQILMDEYQDTNGQQSRLLDLLRGKGNFYGVGDINQSIFGFRYATPEVFRAHRRQVAATGQHHVELFENFRSRAPILYAVETLLEDASGVEAHQLHARRELPPQTAPCIEVTAARADSRDNAERTEAEWIASRILQLRHSLTLGADSRPADFRDIAVLARKTSLIGPLTEAFDRFGVQYQVTRQLGFFESREIRDLTHLLRAISNPRDEISLAVVLRSPLAGLSDQALIRLKDAGRNLGASLDLPVSTLDSLDAERWQRFREHFARWRSHAHQVPLDRLLVEAMADSGYHWTPGSPGGANIEKLLALARGAPAGQSLAEFVHEIHLIREEEAREADAPFDEALNAVRVITAHASKGLEFPIVFVPGMQSAMSRSGPSVTFTAAAGLGAKWRTPGGGKAISDWYRMRNKREIDEREEQESNRLLYVAMTRAEEHLVLSYALGPDDKPNNWAAPVHRVFEMDSVAVDAPARIIRKGRDGREFEAAVSVITRTPAAVALDKAGAFAAQLAELPAPAITGQEDSSVTVTGLTLFADCPRKYFLARYLGWERGPQADPLERESGEPASLPSTELGQQVHALLASQKVASPSFEAIHLAETFDRSELGRRAARARVVERELDFMFAIDEMVVRGQIDLWFEDRAGRVIVDYKTDDVARAAAEARSQAYQLQLRYYAMAIEKMTGALPTEAWLHFLRPDVAVRVDLSSASLAAAKRLVGDLASAQRTRRFPLHEGPHCHRCPFHRSQCPAA